MPGSLLKRKVMPMRLQTISILGVSFLLVATAGSAARLSNAELKGQVIAAERAFAATMQARDHEAFKSFLSDEAVFFSANGAVLRGKEAVANAWWRYYHKPQAPFSWRPEQVEVVNSGTLAYSGGPVYDAGGKLIGRFNSIWRLEAPGRWHVIFDRGAPVCDCDWSPRP
jgi:ketosteroid isomerase-like protein